jgi:hypothetical protein
MSVVATGKENETGKKENVKTDNPERLAFD